MEAREGSASKSSRSVTSRSELWWFSNAFHWLVEVMSDAMFSPYETIYEMGINLFHVSQSHTRAPGEYVT